MTQTAQQYEDMKDGMIVPDVIKRIQDGSHCIEYSPSHQPQKSIKGDSKVQLLDIKYDQPAHQQIHNGGNEIISPGKEDF